MRTVGELWRLGVGIASVVTICVLGQVFGFQQVSLNVLYLTLPVALLFIVAYVPERPWSTWFGTSLLLLAIGVFVAGLAALLFRVYGIDYPFRELLGAVWIGTVFAAMVMRTWVLIAAQWRNRHGVGGLWRRSLRR